MKISYSYCKFCKELVESNHLWQNHYEEKRELLEIIESASQKRRTLVRKIKVLKTKVDPKAKRLANFLAKIEKSGDGCWNWTGARQPAGYGLFYIQGKQVGAHRISFVLFKDNDLPITYVVHHTCENKSCVNPAHLEKMDKKAHWRMHFVKRRGWYGKQ